MDGLHTQRKYEYGGVNRNSYYDIRPHYSQKEKDECRIVEGISKKIKDYTKNEIIKDSGYVQEILR